MTKSTQIGYEPINKAGDSMEGDLILNADPTLPLGAATKQYVDGGGGGGGANTSLSNLVATAVNESLISGGDLIHDLGSAANRWRHVYPQTISTGDGGAGEAVTFRGWNTSSLSYFSFMSIVAGNPPTCNIDGQVVLNDGVTATTQPALTNDTTVATTEYVDTAVSSVSGANQQLSNLNNTAVNAHISPGINNTFDLGEEALAWRLVYMNELRTPNVGPSPSVAFEAYNTTTASWEIVAGIQGGPTGVPSFILTGLNSAVTRPPGDSSTAIATTAYSDAATAVLEAELDRRVPLNQSDIAASSNITFDLDSGISNYFKVTFTSNCTLSFTFTAGEVASMCIELINAGAFTVTLPVGLQWPAGTAPTFTAAGKDIIVIWNNGDDVVHASVIGQDFS